MEGCKESKHLFVEFHKLWIMPINVSEMVEQVSKGMVFEISFHAISPGLRTEDMEVGGGQLIH